jgi:hypothetical protein
MQHVHSDRLERWLGTEAVNRLVEAQRDFYWPIAVHGVPGKVWAMPGGDFTGEILAGQEMSARDRALDRLTVMRREERARLSQLRIAHSSPLRARMDHRAHAFASLSALITAATTAGKKQDITFSKTGVAVTTVGTASSLWYSAGTGGAGATAGAAPGGTVNSSATAGALPYFNASVNANTHSFTTGQASASVINNTLLLYDRLFSVLKTASSSAAEAVTGVPTRYQNTSSGAVDYAGGNFCTIEAAAALAALAHNWLSSTYTNQAGTGGKAFLTNQGFTAACPIQGIDVTGAGGTASGNWFMTLAAGDVGVQKLTNIQCSVATITGSAVFVLGHPIAYMPCPIANMICIVDGVNTAFNLTKVLDSACLALMEMPKPATGATTYSGQITLVSE